MELPIQIKRFLKYSFSGWSTAFLDVLLLASLTETFGLFYALSATISFTFSNMIHYTINKNWGFKESKITNERGITLFLSLAAINIIAIVLSLTFLVERVGLHYLIAKAITLFVFGMMNFVFHYTVTFKMKKEFEKI